LSKTMVIDAEGREAQVKTSVLNLDLSKKGNYQGKGTILLLRDGFFGMQDECICIISDTSRRQVLLPCVGHEGGGPRTNIIIKKYEKAQNESL